MHQRCGNRADVGYLLANVGPLDRTEDEHLVFYDRPAQLAAVLVPLEAQLTGCEIIMRVQYVIPEEFPRRAMKLVRPRTEDDVDHRAAPAEFCVHRVFLYAKLLDGVGRRLDHNGAIAKFVVVQPIKKKVVIGGSGSGAGSCGSLIRSGAKVRKLEEISTVQRQLNDAFFVFKGS